MTKLKYNNELLIYCSRTLKLYVFATKNTHIAQDQKNTHFSQTRFQ